LHIEQRAAAHRIERRRPVLVDNLPRPLTADNTRSASSSLGFALVVGAAAMRDPMGEGEVVGGLDGDLVELENVRAGAHFHAGFPVRAVGRLALELQGLDRIERDDVVAYNAMTLSTFLVITASR
jgi:hypothetical protein